MTDKKEAKAGRYDRVVRRAVVTTAGHFGLTLGDLRKVVAASEGMGDDAEVTVEESTAHLMRRDEWRIKRVRVYEEVETP